MTRTVSKRSEVISRPEDTTGLTLSDSLLTLLHQMMLAKMFKQYQSVIPEDSL